jgi:hypothetical protein
MPIHDWSRVDANLFHDFHQTWTVMLANALNAGLLPPGLSAIIEGQSNGTSRNDGRSVAELLADRGNRIAIRHRLTRAVSVVEIVSPGNKTTGRALARLIKRTVDFLESGIHVLIVDLFPPSVRDPHGIHKVIWDEIEEQPFELPRDKPMTLAAYVAGRVKTAYVRPIGYSEPLPDMPAWLDEDSYVPVPLEATYETTWASCPQDMREAVEHGLPPEDQME